MSRKWKIWVRMVVEVLKIWKWFKNSHNFFMIWMDKIRVRVERCDIKVIKIHFRQKNNTPSYQVFSKYQNPQKYCTKVQAVKKICYFLIPIGNSKSKVLYWFHLKLFISVKLIFWMVKILAEKDDPKLSNLIFRNNENFQNWKMHF